MIVVIITLFETRLTLLSQASLPLSYWFYTFQITVYLINHKSIFVLQNKSLFECLFDRLPDYKKNICIFGC